MSYSIVRINELSENRAGCLLAARLARHMAEANLATELVAEACTFHRELMCLLRAHMHDSWDRLRLGAAKVVARHFCRQLRYEGAGASRRLMIR
jgi:hypothetical protein